MGVAATQCSALRSDSPHVSDRRRSGDFVEEGMCTAIVRALSLGHSFHICGSSGSGLSSQQRPPLPLQFFGKNMVCAHGRLANECVPSRETVVSEQMWCSHWRVPQPPFCTQNVPIPNLPLTGLGGLGRANALFLHFFASQGGGFVFRSFAFFLHVFFASVLPSDSCYCGNPWTNLCHMHHFDRGGGCKSFHVHFFLHRIFCSLNLQSPPPPCVGGDCPYPCLARVLVRTLSIPVPVVATLMNYVARGLQRQLQNGGGVIWHGGVSCSRFGRDCNPGMPPRPGRLRMDSGLLATAYPVQHTRREAWRARAHRLSCVHGTHFISRL